MTRRVRTGLENSSEYDGPEIEIEAEYDFDMAEIVRPSNRVIVVTPDGPGEAVTSDVTLQKEKAEKIQKQIKAAQDRAIEEAAAKAKAKVKAAKKKAASKPKK